MEAVDVDEVARTREELRSEAREVLGVTLTEEQPPSLRQVLRDNKLSIYPLAALGVLGIVDQFQGYAFSVLAPDISRSLGLGKGAIAAIISIKTLAAALSPLPMAALAQHKARRALLCLATGLVWSAVTLTTGFTVAIWGLAFVLVMDGLSSGSTTALHDPLLVDSYPPQSRVRVLSSSAAIRAFGNVLSPLLVAALVTWAGLTWRGVFVALGVGSFAGCFFAFRLKDPGFGRFDTEAIRETVRERHGKGMGDVELEDRDVELGFFETFRRLMLIPTIRRLLIALAVFGLLLIPYQTFLFFFLEERWGMGPSERALFFAFNAAVSIVALQLFAKQGEAMFRKDPGNVARLSGKLLAASVILIALGGLAPWFWLMIFLFAASGAVTATIGPALGAALLGVIPSQMRPHAGALQGIFLGGIGGLAGSLFLGGIDRRFGVGGAMVALLIPGVAGALLLGSTGKLIGKDLDRMIDEVIEDEEIRQIRRSGGHLPMLACRGVDFSYGQLQVLFDVDFTVDDGEMVALLGVNGAGKSTLLKAVSGIGLPSAGSVRYRGSDITYLDAERRLRLGITQIPGGRAVFNRMSVVDNLLGFAHTLGNDKKRIDAKLDACFEAFPRLAERRNQNAGTLSGGEQQMLGLSKGLILEPKLLLIDELSLGLAPVIVGQLLDMVRQINAQGTAIVLVEQSVNIALNLVDHAYFMESGEMKFDGPSKELLAREDLLRAVFLEGSKAAKK